MAHSLTRSPALPAKTIPFDAFEATPPVGQTQEANLIQDSSRIQAGP
jgi:hypothetical protein